MTYKSPIALKKELKEQFRKQVDEQFRKDDPERWEAIQKMKARNPSRHGPNKPKPKSKPLIEVAWRRMTPSKPPKGSGVYAIKSGRQWLYIGKAQSIWARVLTPRHPMQITSGLDALKLSYWYCLLPAELMHRAECQQIKQHEPEWNGGTEWFAYHTVHGPTCQWSPPLTVADIKRALFDPTPTTGDPK